MSQVDLYKKKMLRTNSLRNLTDNSHGKSPEKKSIGQLERQYMHIITKGLSHQTRFSGSPFPSIQTTST